MWQNARLSPCLAAGSILLVLGASACGRVGQVDGQKRRTKLTGGGAALILGDVGQDQRRAVTRKAAGDFRPQTARRAGDKDGATGQHHSAACDWASSAST